MNRRYLATVVVATMVVAACSGSQNDTGDSSTTASAAATTFGATSSSAASTTSSPTSTNSTGTSAAPTTTPPTTAFTTTSDSAGPPVAEANGWRLVVTQPAQHTSIGMKPLLCYEATGTSREAILALDVRLVEVAAGSVVFEERRDVNVGRDGVALDLVDIEPGRYRLAVGLVVDGELSDGLTLEVPDLTLVEGTPAALCK